MMGVTQFPAELEQIVYSILEEEVPSVYTFHSRDHARRVLEAANYLCEKEDIAESHRILVLTAALLHDVGFRESRTNHERTSANFAHDILPGFGYSLGQVDQIHALILQTAGVPSKHLDMHSGTEKESIYAQILLDACWEYIGAADRLDQLELLYKEELHEGLITDRIRFYEKQVAQITRHTYFTPTVLAEWQPNKMSLKLWLEREVHALRNG